MSRRSKAALEVALSLSLEDCGFKKHGTMIALSELLARLRPQPANRLPATPRTLYLYLIKIKDPALFSVISAACHPTPQLLRCALTATSP